MTTLHDVYVRAVAAHEAADDAWQAALEAAYGKAAGDARYDRRGYATPELAQLHTAKMTAAIEQSVAFQACMAAGGWAAAKQQAA